MSPIRVLIVDDSAFARKVIREVLARDPEIEVIGFARDGLEALEKIGELRPDVVTLDLMMPELDGLGVLRALPREGAPKVIVVSVSASEAELAIEALQAGAVDFVTKPTPLPTDRLYELSGDLLTKVKAAVSARPRLAKLDVSAPGPRPPFVSRRATATRLVVIGTSTGGPQALTQLFRALPTALPVPFLVALHIPSGYTAPLAERLTRLNRMKVQEASDGMELKAGQGYIAPGGMHLRVRRDGGILVAEVSFEPSASLYHPSVDVLFESAAEQVGNAALGLVMTGMGEDGMRGARAIRREGGRVLTEAASSCVVYGMPRSVVEAGMSDGQAPLDELPGLLLEAI